MTFEQAEQDCEDRGLTPFRLMFLTGDVIGQVQSLEVRATSRGLQPRYSANITEVD